MKYLIAFQSMQLARHLQERGQNNLNQNFPNENQSQSSDPVLSDLLDQVIEIAPDAFCNGKFHWFYS